jgi:hypothetical protein
MTGRRVLRSKPCHNPRKYPENGMAQGLYQGSYVHPIAVLPLSVTHPLAALTPLAGVPVWRGRIAPGRTAVAREGSGRYQSLQTGLPDTVGTHYLFGRIADKCKLLKDEADEPLSEILEHKA